MLLRMRYLVKARVKSGSEPHLVRAIDDGTFGKEFHRRRRIPVQYEARSGERPGRRHLG